MFSDIWQKWDPYRKVTKVTTDGGRRWLQPLSCWKGLLAFDRSSWRGRKRGGRDLQVPRTQSKRENNVSLSPRGRKNCTAKGTTTADCLP